MPTEIKLTRGFVAIVDDADAPLVQSMSWCAQVRKTGYVTAQNSKREAGTGRVTKTQMHRLIVGAKPGDVVDHINGDPLDNRRGNLRIVTSSENASNGRGRGESKARGVVRSGAKWRATIAPSGLEICLGTFDSTSEAAKTYDAACAVIYRGIARGNGFGESPELVAQVIESKRRAIARLSEEIEFLSGARSPK